MYPVTLITPVWNGAAYLPAYLDSVLAQTLEKFEFLLVDDGSDDDSRAVAAGYRERFRRRGIDFTLLTQSHAGQAAAMNTALAAVRGDTIAWADADDLLHPDNLLAKYLWLQQHPDCGMVRNLSRTRFAVTGREEITRYDRNGAGETEPQAIFDGLFHETIPCYAGCYLIRTRLFWECYPRHRIPESPVGQNLQMLLPPASRTRCGLVPQILFTRMLYPRSHSRNTVTPEEQRQRSRQFFALTLRILDFCEVDRQKYRAEAGKRLAAEQTRWRREEETLDRLRQLNSWRRTIAGIRRLRAGYRDYCTYQQLTPSPAIFYRFLCYRWQADSLRQLLSRALRKGLSHE